MKNGRRAFLAGSAAIGAAARAASISPDWASLGQVYNAPDWFRDAKFGIWAHWSAQCVPEAGDWYGRLMYAQGQPAYEHHLKHYGHPADHGFLEIEGAWKAEAWDPEALIALYKKAGAKYFMALASHHDNLDTWASSHHPWNALRVGPKRDIVGTWEKLVREAGLRFGVSNHSSHAWHWWQTAYGYDAEGPRRGERYDAFKLTKADGKGKWWEGLDPQDLYTGSWYPAPDGITSIKAMDAWHDAHDGQWLEDSPPAPAAFVANWLARQKELVEKYRPDMVYFDDTGIPFGQTGLEAVAHYYEKSIEWHGKIDVVATGKKLSDVQRRAVMEDIERGYSDHLRAEPWQTCTCIGDWHYNRQRFLDKSYVPAEQVIQRLCDIVSKNGNLLLSIPVRGNGTIDSEEEKIVAGITTWMAVNGDAIYGSRPWRIYGAGPTKVDGGMFSEGKVTGFQSEDVRFTVKNSMLNMAMLRWPDAPVRVPALGLGPLKGAKIARVSLFGGGAVTVQQTADAATFTLPRAGAGQFVPMLRLEGAGLA